MRLLTVREVASQVALSEAAVRRAIANGELSAFRLRSRIRLRPNDVERWIAACVLRVPPSVPSRSVTADRSRSQPIAGLRVLLDLDRGELAG